MIFPGTFGEASQVQDAHVTMQSSGPKVLMGNPPLTKMSLSLAAKANGLPQRLSVHVCKSCHEPPLPSWLCNDYTVWSVAHTRDPYLPSFVIDLRQLAAAQDVWNALDLVILSFDLTRLGSYDYATEKGVRMMLSTRSVRIITLTPEMRSLVVALLKTMPVIASVFGLGETDNPVAGFHQHFLLSPTRSHRFVGSFARSSRSDCCKELDLFWSLHTPFS